MSIQTTPYTFPFLAAAAVALIIAGLSWNRTPTPGARTFGALMIFVAWNCMDSVLLLGSTTLTAFFFWVRMSFIGGGLSILWLAFVRQYTGYNPSKTRRLTAWLTIEPAAVFLLAWSNDAHHLLWSNAHIEQAAASGVMLRAGFTFGPLFWVWSLYQYVLLVAGAVILVQNITHAAAGYRGQLLTVLAALILPWSANILFLAGKTPVNHVDPTPLAFAASNVILFFALFRFHFLDLVPVTRSFVLEASPNGVLVLDGRNRIVDINPTAETILDCQARDVLGKQGTQVMPELATIAAGTEAEFTHMVNGQERTYALHATALRERSGRLVVLNDITERKRISRQLTQTQKMDALGLMASGIAHDFNNLLTSIIGNISMVREQTEASSSTSELLVQAEQAASKASDLTHSLLAFSRNGGVSPMVTQLSTAIDTTLQALGRTLPSSVTVLRQYDTDLWNILIDPAQLTQITINLVINARDAMAGNGIMTIRTANVAIDGRFVLAHPEARTGEHVLFAVSDTGEGMTDFVQQHLFEPFFTTKPLGHGTGLGLSVVYGAVQQAGGWIMVKTALGQGSTFSLYFPRCREPVPALHPAKDSLSVPSGRETVLVIDDEQMVLQLASRMLRRCGYSTLTAQDGSSAIALFQKQSTKVDLIILDMTMLDMMGDQVLWRLRQCGVTAPVIISSGYSLTGGIQELVGAPGGADGFLPKPYNLQELATMVRRTLDEHKPETLPIHV